MPPRPPRRGYRGCRLPRTPQRLPYPPTRHPLGSRRNRSPRPMRRQARRQQRGLQATGRRSSRTSSRSRRTSWATAPARSRIYSVPQSGRGWGSRAPLTRSRQSPSYSWTPRGSRVWPQPSRPGSKTTPLSASRRAVERLALALVGAVAAIAVGAGCSNPPQVVDISPQRGAAEVRSNQLVRVKFDRGMDRGSVQARFHIVPAVPGGVRWLSDSELTFEHQPFTPLTRYQAILDPGYRDAQGVINGLRHSWNFKTESPPALTAASPGQGDRDMDPASYLTLTFSREMNPASLGGAISLSPSAPFHIRQDPTDRRRVTLAPDSLLEQRVTYSVTVSPDARDVDGNRVVNGNVVTFTTGDFRALRHWVSFIAEPWPGSGNGGDGVWIVNESRFPRRLVQTPVTAFSWSPDGSRLLLRSPSGSWSEQPLAGAATSLPIVGAWADFLAPGLGYAFLDGGKLQVLRPDGSKTLIASAVKAAAVAPGGGRLAFVVGDASGSGSEIYAYDPDPRTSYRLQAEPAPIDGLAWSPDGLGLAYRVATSDPKRHQIKVRSLKDGGVVTVAAGPV